MLMYFVIIATKLILRIFFANPEYSLTISLCRLFSHRYFIFIKLFYRNDIIWLNQVQVRLPDLKQNRTGSNISIRFIWNRTKPRTIRSQPCGFKPHNVNVRGLVRFHTNRMEISEPMQLAVGHPTASRPSMLKITILRYNFNVNEMWKSQRFATIYPRQQISYNLNVNVRRECESGRWIRRGLRGRSQ